jgi:hypothetical protein
MRSSLSGKLVYMTFQRKLLVYRMIRPSYRKDLFQALASVRRMASEVGEGEAVLENPGNAERH